MCWNSVKAVLQQEFSWVPMQIHIATHCLHRYQQKGKGLQEFNLEFIELIQVVISQKWKGTSDPFKMYMYAQKLFNLAISDRLSGMLIQHCKMPLTIL